MNLRQLEYIENIVRYGTMREAARQLFVTEPTISQQIKKFEEEIGFPFFEKNGRIINLTKEGQSLLPEIRNILSSVHDLERQIKEISNPLSGQIQLGIGPLSAIRYLPRLFKTFHQRYPKVKLIVVQGGIMELSELLFSNQLDIIVAPINNKTRQKMELNNTECKILFDDEYIAIVSTNHPLSNKSKISVRELSDEQLILYRAGLIREYILSVFGEDFKDNIIFSTENNESTRELVKLGIGISIIPKFYFDTWSTQDLEGIHSLHFKDVDIKPNPCVIYKRDRYIPEYLKDFIKILKTFDEKIEKS